MRKLEHDLRETIRSLVESGGITTDARKELHKVLKRHRDRELEPTLQVANLRLHLDSWERHQHVAVGIPFLRDHFNLR